MRWMSEKQENTTYVLIPIGQWNHAPTNPGREEQSAGGGGREREIIERRGIDRLMLTNVD